MKFSFYRAALLGALMASSCQAQTALVDAPELPLPSSASNEMRSGLRGSEPVRAVTVAALPAVRRGEIRLEWTDWGLIGTAAVLRVLDYTSTETCMAHPGIFQEQILPSALVDNKTTFAAFEGSTVVADYYAYRYLARHHRAAVRTGQAIYDGMMGTAVSINYYGIHKYLH